MTEESFMNRPSAAVYILILIFKLSLEKNIRQEKINKDS